ncbi:MAG: YgiT-type zinc finger protein [Gammaproteobacteria bacterium]|nr:YgiT-type zinc finger protein [Gammaproteobacteria bacterium]
MECLHCKGNMSRNKVPFSIDRNGYHISWDSIPAWVCTQCGEPFFEESEVKHIQSTLIRLDKETYEMIKAA